MRQTLIFTAVVVFVLVASVVAGATPTHDAHRAATGASPDVTQSIQSEPPNPCVGTIRKQPSRTTLLSIQGARGGEKTPALLLGIAPDGGIVSIHNDSASGRWWVYDVDPLSHGNLLLSTTEPGISVVEEIDPETGEHTAIRRFPDVLDSHDADRINGDELLLNDMSQEGDDRVMVYNLTREEVVWEYRFAEHPEAFPREGGGEYGGDWTHNNDVERIRPGVFMVSVRNFDQVVAINRSTKELVWTLGADDDRDVLFEQHNPDYIESEDGRPTVLVADSRNDRVAEYERHGAGGDAEWVRTWVLRGGGLDEPRDVDRLPNGNTLVIDRRGHRVVEVTPQGEVVWEVYTPWQPYDGERYGLPDESTAPTAQDLGATGTHEMTGSADFGTDRVEECATFLTSWSGGSQLVPEAATPTKGQAATDGSDDPADTGTSESFLETASDGDGPGGLDRLWPSAVALAVLVGVVLGLTGVVVRRWWQ